MVQLSMSFKKLKNIAFIRWSVISFPLLFLYNNCQSNLNEAFVLQAESSKLEGGGGGSGNGEPFDGKIYNRKVPGNSCLGQTRPVGQILTNGERYSLVSNQGQTCGAIEQIDQSNILKAKNTDQVLAYKDGLFIQQLSVSDQTDEVFSESWCRSIDSTYGDIDVVVKWNSQDKAASMQLFSNYQGQAQSSMSHVYRQLTPSTVSYGSNEAFLEIKYHNSPVGQLHDRIGNLIFEYKVGKWASLNVFCRMGGQFDSSAPLLNYSKLVDIFSLNSNIANLLPTTTHSVIKYSVSPALPNGLILDSVTGIVSGRPEVTSPLKDYVVEAKLNLGSVSTVLKIGVGEEYRLTRDDVFSGFLSNLIYLSKVNPAVILLPDELIELNGSSIDISGGSLKIVGQQNTELSAAGKSKIFTVIDSNLLLQNLKINNGMSTENGGAILSNNSYLSLERVQFNNNQVVKVETTARALMGGALYLYGGGLFINECEFYGNFVDNNQYGSNGGALAIHQPKYGYVTINSSKFYNNFAFKGGAIYSTLSLSNHHLLVFKSEFDNNSSYFGGALWLDLGLATVQFSSFTANGAISKGGAIMTNASSGVWVKQSKFGDNHAPLGPAIYLNSTILDSALNIEQSVLSITDIYSQTQNVFFNK